MDHVVFYSGGMSSFFTAQRVVNKYGNSNLRLLFTDTKYEDEDLYRFLKEGAQHLGGELIWIEDGRDPWEIFHDVKFLGNTRVDPCSKILKRDLARKWVYEAYPDPSKVILYLGMNYDEINRLERSRSYWKPYRMESPLTEKPYMQRRHMMSELDGLGIPPPRLYELGFPHNNCGGFCIKAGHAHFRLLLQALPEKYAEVERKEEEMRQLLAKDVAILRDRTGGTLRPLTLREFRQRETKDLDLFEWGGCGCFGDFSDEELPEVNLNDATT